jgi:hypothetical protein
MLGRTQVTIRDDFAANLLPNFLFVNQPTIPPFHGFPGGRMRSIRYLAAIGLLCMCVAYLSASAAAQSFQGGLRGVVKDPQGVIPGATVTLVNEQNNVSRETDTNDVGEYSFPADRW